MIQAPRFILGYVKIRHMSEHLLQAPGFIYTGSFQNRHMREDMLQAPARIHTGSFKIRNMREDMLQAPARIHTGSFKIRHMHEICYKPQLGFMVDLLRLDICLSILMHFNFLNIK